MLLPLGVFLDCILHPDLSSREELSIHLGDRCIGTIEIIIADKTMTFTASILRVPCDFGADDHAKITESLIE